MFIFISLSYGALACSSSQFAVPVPVPEETQDTQAHAHVTQKLAYEIRVSVSGACVWVGPLDCNRRPVHVASMPIIPIRVTQIQTRRVPQARCQT
jgi:hypothetical protein